MTANILCRVRASLGGALWLAVILVLSPGSAQAAEATPRDIPVLPAGLLVDQSGMLDNPARESLSRRLTAIQSSGRAQVAIFVASDIGGEPLTAFSLRTAEAWRLGRADRDDGLLILLVPSRNLARIEVGYGLEAVIPDVLASRWLEELLPAIQQPTLAVALEQLLDKVERVLPEAANAGKVKQLSGVELLEAHPEWVLPFFLLMLSPMTLIPLFVMRRGHLVSGPLLAIVLGLLAWALKDVVVGVTVAVCTLPFPYFWSLNGLVVLGPRTQIAPWKIYARLFGNGVAVLGLFAVASVLIWVLMPGEMIYRWFAMAFAGIFAVLLATHLFPGKAESYLSNAIPGIMIFAFLLVAVHFALKPLLVHPDNAALAISASIVALIQLTVYFDQREKERDSCGLPGGIPWSLILCGLSLLVVIPFALLALVRAATGDDWLVRLVEAASGGGAVGGALAGGPRWLCYRATGWSGWLVRRRRCRAGLGRVHSNRRDSVCRHRSGVRPRLL